MKSTGIVRKIDNLGRIVIPMELRRTLGIVEKDSLEIYVDGETIMLKKYQPMCGVCHESDDLVPMLAKHGIKVCHKCYKEAEK